MADVLTIHERPTSGAFTEGPNASASRKYTIRGTDDEVTAKNFLGQQTPLTHDGLRRQDYSVAYQGANVFYGEVTYSWEPAKKPGQSRVTFSTGGGSQHITQSKGTTKKFPSNAPDYKGAINVTDKAVNGVDIIVPAIQFAETHYFGASVVTGAYIALLTELTGKVNNAGFKGFNAYEVLFLGTDGGQRGNEDWELTFKFAGSKNKTGIKIGEIAGISKRGWEYVWTRYQDEEDKAAKAIVKKPEAVYVEEVYEADNFSKLAIGV